MSQLRESAPAAPRRSTAPAAQPFLSTLEAGARERAFALGVVLVSGLIFAALAPLAKTPLPAQPAFLPLYQSALVVSDLVTSVLLFGQFAILGTPGLLVLGAAYLFSAGMAVAHALSFPGLLAPAGLFGAGPQTTAWLYFFWHGGFPLAVIAYALLPGKGAELAANRALASILGCAALVLALVAGLYALAAAGNDALPVIMHGDRDAPAKAVVATASWMLSLAAICVLWVHRRPVKVLDLWLMVVLWVWVFDVALAAVLNAGRFDLGWYGGRVYGLLAGSVVLIAMLVEYTYLHGELIKAREAALAQRAELQVANRELESFSYSVSHDLRTPLRAIDGYARMLEEDYAAKVDDEGRRLLSVVRASSRRMARLIDDLLAFSQVGRKPIARDAIDMTDLAREALASVLPDGSKARVEIGALPAANGDRALLRQVWVNLVGNALKYSGKREAPLIQIGGDAGGREIVYWVRDNGSGFDMRRYDRLFGVFQRLHRAEEFEGTGVGLAIVQRIVARHGGRVWAEGAPERGACFSFALPGAD